MALGCRRLPRRIAHFSQQFVHYSILGFGDRTGPGMAGRYFSLSDWRSLCATYSAALLSPCHLRRNSTTSHPWSPRGMAIPRRKRKCFRGPRRKASASPVFSSLSASSELTCFCRHRTISRGGCYALGFCGRRLPELNLIPIQVIDPGKATVGFIHSVGVNLYSLLF